MKKIFIGTILAFLNFSWSFDFNIFVGARWMSVEFIPTFIGYVLIALGAMELSGKNKNFKYAAMISPFAAAFSLYEFIRKLFGVSIYFIDTDTDMFSPLYLLYLAGTALCLTAFMLVVTGIAKMEKEDENDYNAVSLKNTARIAVIANIFWQLPFGMPYYIYYTLVAIIIISALALIYQMYFTQRMYCEANPKKQ